MLKDGEFFMIRELHQKGWTQTAISEETGFDRKTIRKYINQNQLPKRKGDKKSKGSKLDDYKEYLLKRLKEGTTNCVVLLEEIQGMGYDGQMTILREFISPFREKPNKQSSIRFETPPGKQAQMDWGELGEHEIDGKKQKLYVFVIVLGYSRMKYMEITTTMNMEQLMKCHMNAFSYFNGVPSQILYDNMKTVVIKHSPTEIRFNRKFEEFLAYYGIVPKACKPARPQSKGKVESAVGYVKKNFMQRKLEPSLVKMNESLIEWLDKIANKKPNQTTKESPFERFEVEQEKLLNWNQRPLFPMSRWTTTRVDKQGYISYENKLYSVPYRFKGAEVKIKETLEHHIEVYYELDCIATHPMINGNTKSIAQLKHYKENKKEETKVTPKGLATGHNPLSGPKVEQRSLLVYEEQSKVGEYE
jgi:transposase